MQSLIVLADKQELRMSKMWMWTFMRAKTHAGLPVEQELKLSQLNKT
jgi:hypothetical protein